MTLEETYVAIADAVATIKGNPQDFLHWNSKIKVPKNDSLPYSAVKYGLVGTISNIGEIRLEFGINHYEVYLRVSDNRLKQINELVSPSLAIQTKYSNNKLNNIKLIREYKLKEFDSIWLSNNGTLFIGNKPVSRNIGKFLRKISGSELEGYQLTELVERIKIKQIDFSKYICIDSVGNVYNNTPMGVGSCMTGRDISLVIYDWIDVQCIYYMDESKGHIRARTLIYPDKKYSRVYADSSALGEAFTAYLNKIGYSKLESFTSALIRADVKECFIPYMDMAYYIHVESGGFRFSTERSDIVARSTNGDGAYN